MPSTRTQLRAHSFVLALLNSNTTGDITEAAGVHLEGLTDEDQIAALGTALGIALAVVARASRAHPAAGREVFAAKAEIGKFILDHRALGGSK